MVCSDTTLSELQDRPMAADCRAQAQHCDILFPSSGAHLFACRKENHCSCQHSWAEQAKPSSPLQMCFSPWSSQELSGLCLLIMPFSNKTSFSQSLSDSVSPSVKWEPCFCRAKGHCGQPTLGSSGANGWKADRTKADRCWLHCLRGDCSLLPRESDSKLVFPWQIYNKIQ